MNEGISRRKFLKTMTAGLAAAAIPDILHVSDLVSLEFANNLSDKETFALTDRFIDKFPDLRCFKQEPTLSGTLVNFPIKSKGYSEAEIRLLHDCEPGFVLMDHDGIIRTKATDREFYQAVKKLGEGSIELLNGSLTHSPVENRLDQKTVMLVGDSYTLWRNMPSLLQSFLARSGHNITVTVSAAYGTGVVEAYQRLHNTSVFEDPNVPIEVVHLIHPSTDFVPDMEKAMVLTQDTAGDALTDAAIYQTATRSITRRYITTLFGKSLGKGSYIPMGIMDKKYDHFREEMGRYCRNIKDLASNKYQIVMLGDPSFTNPEDFDRMDAISRTLSKQVFGNEHSDQLTLTDRSYPTSEFDQYQHPTRLGAKYVVMKLYEQITHQIPNEQLMDTLMHERFIQQQAMRSFMQKKLSEISIDSIQKSKTLQDFANKADTKR